MSTMPRRNRPRAYSYLRFSTPEQAQGDSFRRQLEMSRRYAEVQGLELDETFSFEDLGVSAYHGKNATEGALADFIDAVDDGRVLPGSYLLVESLDPLRGQRWPHSLRGAMAVTSGVAPTACAPSHHHRRRLPHQRAWQGRHWRTPLAAADHLGGEGDGNEGGYEYATHRSRAVPTGQPRGVLRAC